MLKAFAVMSVIAFGVFLAAPAKAQDNTGPRAGDGPRERPQPDMAIQPRGQRDQTMPRGDAYSTGGPEDDDLDVADPAEAPPVERRL
jgi:hypothetical protein